jgi:ABC-type nitrate/sulfonate/bicarbonate transport system substrate-binding protein
MENITLKIGGVPEHFNLPWQLAIDENLFLKENINLDWQYFPGGTGAMTKALQEGELDLAILLTEGFIAAIDKGLQARVVKEYITSPLIWGIFTGADSDVNSIYDRKPKKYAISRLGSGSHLMAMIHAEQRGERIKASELIEVRSLDAAIASLKNNETQIFYWEKYTTKPFVTAGDVRMIGEFSAPWSSFLIVATEKALQEKADAIQKAMSIINAKSYQFKQDKNSVLELVRRFKMSEQDARNWLQSTVWNTDFTIRKSGLTNAENALMKINGAQENQEMKDWLSNLVEVI